MPIYGAIANLKASVPMSEQQAETFLRGLSPTIQEQLIAAIYIGRDHLHNTTLRNDTEISRAATEHIPQEDYARIIYEKGSSIESYLSALEQCATSSGFDLNAL